MPVCSNYANNYASIIYKCLATEQSLRVKFLGIKCFLWGSLGHYVQLQMQSEQGRHLGLYDCIHLKEFLTSHPSISAAIRGLIYSLGNLLN